MNKLNENVFLILKRYLDGEIIEILGYANDENIIKKRVSSLNKYKPSFEQFYYDYEIISKIED